jgi:hypothetical protein
VAVAECGVLRHGQKLKYTFYYFDSVQVSEQFTYILTSGKAVLPRYLWKGGTHFELYFPIFSKHK